VERMSVAAPLPLRLLPARLSSEPAARVASFTASTPPLELDSHLPPPVRCRPTARVNGESVVRAPFWALPPVRRDYEYYPTVYVHPGSAVSVATDTEIVNSSGRL
jgi:hypothetical protein